MLLGMSVTLATVVQLPVRPVDEPAGWAERIHHVIDQLEKLLDHGQAAEVVDLCQRAVWFLEDSAPEIAETAPLYGLADRLGAVHLRACRDARPEPVALARWLFETEFRGDLGAVTGAAEAYSDVLGPEGLAELRRLAGDAWRGPRGCSAIARSIDRFRLRPIMTSLARAAHPTAG
jgi:hypothetical protein